MQYLLQPCPVTPAGANHERHRENRHPTLTETTMDIKRHQFDHTDPFARPKQQAAQLKHWQAQMKRMSQLVPPDVLQGRGFQENLGGTVHYEPSARISTVEMPTWDGESMAQASQPSVIYRPRRIARHIPWQWRMRVAVIRLTRMINRSVRRQLRQFRRFNRQLRSHRR